MTLPASSVLRVTARMKSSVFGDMVAVYHITNIVEDTGSDASIIAAIQTWLSTVYATIAAQLRDTCDPYDLRVDQVELVGGVERLVRTLGTVSWVLSSPPSSAGEGVSPQDAGIVNFRTALPGVFGRKYIGALGEGSTGNGVLTSALITALTDYAAALITGFTHTAVVYVFGVLSPKSAGSNKFAPILAAVVNSIMGTQRRRRINRGS